MTLQYIRLGNLQYDFDTKVNVFIAEKNSGKTSLLDLISFIYGKKQYGNSRLYTLLKQLAKKDIDYFIEWKFSNEEIVFSLLPSNYKVSTSNGKVYNISGYTEYINNKIDGELSILNQKRSIIDFFRYDTNIIELVNSNTEYSKFMFNNKPSATYTSLACLRLLNEILLENKNSEIFIEVGKQTNLRKELKGSEELLKLNKKFTEDTLITNNIDTISEYTNLSKINYSKLNDLIFLEIEQLCKNIESFNINKVKDYHDSLVTSFNEVVDKERIEYIKKNPFLDGYDQNELKRYVQYQKLDSDIKQDLNNVTDRIILLTKDTNEEEFDLINHKINKFTSKFNKELNVEILFENKFKYDYDKNKSIKNLLIDLRPPQNDQINNGGSDTTVNFIGFLTYLFVVNEFPVLIFEKSFISEIANSLIPNILNSISKRISSNQQLFLTLHPDEEFSNLKKMTDNINVHRCDRFYFGIKF